MNQNPILNNPYEEPEWHYSTNLDGELDYEEILPGRRTFVPVKSILPKTASQKDIFPESELLKDSETHPINLIRKEVTLWREERYKNTTRITLQLLEFWFLNPERPDHQRLFFAQREAVETAIWLNEVAPKTDPGRFLLQEIGKAQNIVSSDKRDHLPRIAFKMATGTGKTVVMACLILYHFFNRKEYKKESQYADSFLIVCPGITIRDRLSVLFVDKTEKLKKDRKDYYAVRNLVPPNLEDSLGSLNAKLVITNYHSFETRNIQGNKKSPFDGKISGHDENGKPIKQEAKEDSQLMIKRVLGKFKKGSRLLVLNDEAHHCYLPKTEEKTTDNEDSDENQKAAIWFSGLRDLSSYFQIERIYDLSATPYYLSGSGYPAYSLFGWVVSDFGLVEAIESGLVKIPFLPESDNTHELAMPVLRNLYDHVREHLPKKGQRKAKGEAKEKNGELQEGAPRIPALVKIALDQFYNHYVDYCNRIRNVAETEVDLFSKPPVFIIVCNNTSVSKEVYKFIAGYEHIAADGEIQKIKGHYDLFSNYDQYNQLKKKSPTLLIDSDALENSDQINEDFKKIFASEIESFKWEYAKTHGQASSDQITDAEILREVVNTVGNPGKLGAHIRCVVSVSMLTEGWDANTVTHIMGLRAFGSQLLCEQVAGRALRRMNYYLQGYDKEGNPTEDKRKIVVKKFPPEYAHIIGIPFKIFKGGTTILPPDPPPFQRIFAIPERAKELEIEFPRVDGYRIEQSEEELKFDFSGLEPYTIDGTKFPIETVMATSFSPNEEKMEVRSVLQKRDQEMVYVLTKHLMNYHFSDDENRPYFQKFSQLKKGVEIWYQTKIKLLNIEEDDYKKLIYFDPPKTVVDHIVRGINPHRNTIEFIKPVLNYYNRLGSTRTVNGLSSKELYETTKSHVNYVVMDSEWEGICAKTLEELPEVKSYVKNQYLGFTIPYVKGGNDHLYYPDFIAVIQLEDRSVNLIIEISGFSNDKDEKKWYVENRWLPAVNSIRGKYGWNEWYFIEIANDIRDIKNQLIGKIQEICKPQK
jgi:type III restriction enzyme